MKSTLSIFRGFATLSTRQPKILAFSGSAREGSVNQKLAIYAAKLARDLEADVKVLEPKEYPLPLYCQDLEAKGFPEEVLLVKQMLAESDGFLIASPEYNGSFSPMLKNLIDWSSRPTSKDEHMAAAFKGKVAGIMAASPGGLGGLRGLGHLRELLTNLGVSVVPDQVAVGGAFKAFSEDGELTNEMQNNMLSACVHQVVETSRMWANQEAHCELVRKMREQEKCAELGKVISN